ncbi:hypothetical protein [Enhygromyxa salina]|uniref:Uncharacterized protein n=1 Tax=Enhygromyxa salina TaxID=215803 RepID=A0A2S9YUK2_9BACT|nr:hypothetical protein [Enhygromyxa salina]PRQ08764.1 hypothetical protein ENSA7_13960 [Enhygromyxa salina]
MALGDGDGDYPGMYHCDPAGEPCFQSCETFVEGLTCDTMCTSVGETCVAYERSRGGSEPIGDQLPTV